MNAARARRRSILAKSVALYLCFAVALFYLLAPPAWMVVSSFSPDAELYARPPHWIPDRPTLRHYATLLQLPGADAVTISRNPWLHTFARSFFNSAVIASASALLCVGFGSITAYSLSRFPRPRTRRRLLLALLASRMVPVVSVIIPIYVSIQKAGLIDTLPGLILVDSGLLIPFVIWILEGYFRSFPTELEESAALDGCSPLGIFGRIVLPLSRNGLFAAATFVFISVWSDFIVGLSLTSSPSAEPISVALAQALNPISEPSWGLLNSAGLLAALVPAILAFLLRGMVMRGMLSGAVKG
ncbi:MAG: carbohydrate ABC transporter permease [Acidisphaera sp.]|nr:carbohydrate ABC transporter permease [Acidisphaera sp.]